MLGYIAFNVWKCWWLLEEYGSLQVAGLDALYPVEDLRESRLQCEGVWR